MCPDDTNHLQHAGAAELPTIAEYLPWVLLTVSASTLASYGSYWDRILDAFGSRRLDQIRATDIEALMRVTSNTALRRRNHRDGRSAADHLLLALRRIYRCAINDQLIRPNDVATVSIMIASAGAPRVIACSW